MSGDCADLSRAVSHALRHEPWLYELELDDAGWTPVDALVKALSQEPRWRDLSRAQLETMIERAPKQRHEIDGSRIRALYGHSVSGRIAKTPGEPPAVLFHGTAASSAPAILAKGLRPMQRQYVHLSVDRDTAYSVGRRKNAAVAVLVIRASEARQHGARFWPGNQMVWLADYIPPAFIREDSGG
ncbi:MAG: putative 2-phosphotransferase [Streptosporangiaceae bacterium]|nr:putative 2-phosphotransferase [Streptosporangiaceae bacterium]